MAMMKTLPFALALLVGAPQVALANNYSQRGYSQQQECYKTVYREEYVPGTKDNPGYVKRFNERVAVPCDNTTGGVPAPAPLPAPAPQPQANVDDNSCVEGSILGGIAGGGIGAALSRGDGRWWAIPTGVVTGAVAGCRLDGG